MEQSMLDMFGNAPPQQQQQQQLQQQQQQQVQQQQNQHEASLNTNNSNDSGNAVENIMFPAYSQQANFNSANSNPNEPSGYFPVQPPHNTNQVEPQDFGSISFGQVQQAHPQLQYQYEQLQHLQEQQFQHSNQFLNVNQNYAQQQQVPQQQQTSVDNATSNNPRDNYGIYNFMNNNNPSSYQFTDSKTGYGVPIQNNNRQYQQDDGANIGASPNFDFNLRAVSQPVASNTNTPSFSSYLNTIEIRPPPTESRPEVHALAAKRSATGSIRNEPSKKKTKTVTSSAPPEIPIAKQKDPITAIKLSIADIFRKHAHDIKEQASKLSDLLMNEIPESTWGSGKPDLRTAAITQILSIANNNPEFWETLTTDVKFLARLRNWIFYDYKNKLLDSSIPLMTFFYKIPFSQQYLELIKLDKVLSIIAKKDKTPCKDIATKILFKAKQISTQEKSNNEISKPKSKKPSGSITSKAAGDKSHETKKPASGASGFFKSLQQRPALTTTGRLQNKQPQQPQQTQSSTSKQPQAATAQPKPSQATPVTKPVIPVKPNPMAERQSISNVLQQIRPRSETTNKTDSPPSSSAKLPQQAAKKKKTVSWKAEADLVQVKEFESDPNERGLVGAMRGQFTNARSLDRSEAKMAFGSENREMEEEEDVPWSTPVEVDFSGFSNKVKESNPMRNGGTKAVDSQDAKLQREREKVVLIAMYATPQDIPPSPKEPQGTKDELELKTKTIPLQSELMNDLDFMRKLSSACRSVFGESGYPSDNAPERKSSPPSGYAGQIRAPSSGMGDMNPALSALQALSKNGQQNPHGAPQQVPSGVVDNNVLMSALQSFAATQQKQPADTVDTAGLLRQLGYGVPGRQPQQQQQPPPPPPPSQQYPFSFGLPQFSGQSGAAADQSRR